MEASDVKRLKDLELENSRLKRLLADTILDKEILKDVIEKKGWVSISLHSDPPVSVEADPPISVYVDPGVSLHFDPPISVHLDPPFSRFGFPSLRINTSKPWQENKPVWNQYETFSNR
jgi:hypothetical protein